MSDNPLAPIKRETPNQRLAAFLDASNDIYNKYSVYDFSSGGQGLRLGFQQPYVWTKISDSSLARDLTKYDTQAIPIGSTVRDEERLTKLLASGIGLQFVATQYLIQRQTAFNEIRIYNPLSVLSAAAQQASTGIIDIPTRHLEIGSGGIINFAKSSLLSLIGQQLDDNDTSIEGVASADVSAYAKVGLGRKGKGYVHFEAGSKAQDRFNNYWIETNSNTGGGFLQQLGASLVNSLQRFLPSTLPFGFGSGTDTSNWVYRPEYPVDGDGAYHIFRSDLANYFVYSINGVSYGVEDIAPNFPGIVQQTPDSAPEASQQGWYANPSLSDDAIYQQGELKALYDNLAAATYKFNTDSLGNSFGNRRRLREESQETIGNNYEEAVGTPKTWTGTNGTPGRLTDPLTLDSRGFSKAHVSGSAIGVEDKYNIQVPFKTAGKKVNRGTGQSPDELMFVGQNGNIDPDNSKDIIFFYFYDLVNETYIPFRATIIGFNDLHTPDWDEISYLGRADKLYVYKGFTRDVNFSFTVYANSIKELVPMWQRINYLVGLARPTKYTSGAGTAGGDNIIKQFMFPPMVTFRIGDMYVDQPCVLKSIGVNIPEESLWETQRGTVYTYLQGSGVDLSKYNEGQIMYQLPTKVDMTINMSIMEKDRSLVSGDHFFVSSNTLTNTAPPINSKVAKTQQPVINPTQITSQGKGVIPPISPSDIDQIPVAAIGGAPRPFRLFP